MKDKLYILIFVYWLLLGFIIEGIVHFFSGYRFINLIENTCFLFIVFLVFAQISNITLKQILLKVFCVLMVFMMWFETIMYYQFKISFGPSSFYVALNTNPDELIEFVREYLDFVTLIITILYFIPLLKLRLIVSCLIKISSQYQFQKYKFAKLFLVSFVFLLGIKYSKLIDHNLPYLIGRSVVLNYSDTKWIESFNAKINSEANLFKNNNEDVNNTYVIVIGESATSAHMQLYGYYRETTPLLQMQGDSLYVFNDVISPNTSTFHSLSKALTLGNYEEPKKNLALPITTLFNKSGFKTFWISNHSPAFNPGSALARISNEAQVKHFNSKEVVKKIKKHDEDLLNEFNKALDDNFPNKVVFLHLIGSHFSYENRYPSKFDFFEDVPKTQFREDVAYQKINQYDNSIRYSDFIVNSVLNRLKMDKTNSYLMYFSDHGEEVYQDEDFYGHLEDRPTKNTFTIPFVMWFNQDFKYPKDYVFDKKRKYMTDDLWHSISHISGLENSFVDLKRSIFSSTFVDRKRVILKSKVFDSFFE